MSNALRCMWMRGGTSKGGYFIESDLPQNVEARDKVLLKIMGSPDPRQIDGMGGGDPLTSKVAIVSVSDRQDVDIEYLFLQVFVDQAIVADAQNCGNILAGVAPFAIERGLVEISGKETRVRILMRNTGRIAVAHVQTPNDTVVYHGTSRIDGVPGTHSPVLIEFRNIAGSSCGALLPTENSTDTIDGVKTTMIDNGMPCIIIDAKDVGVNGNETRAELEADIALKDKIETIRLLAGEMMNLGDVRKKSVPKIMLVFPPCNGETISVRSFIPHRVHASIGVLGAITVATAILTPGAVGAEMATIPKGQQKMISLEHLSGETTCILTREKDVVSSASILRTARKLMDGEVYI